MVKYSHKQKHILNIIAFSLMTILQSFEHFFVLPCCLYLRSKCKKKKEKRKILHSQLEKKNISRDWQLWTPWEIWLLRAPTKFVLKLSQAKSAFNTIKQGQIQIFRDCREQMQRLHRVILALTKSGRFHSDSCAHSLSLPDSGYRCTNTHQTLRSLLT